MKKIIIILLLFSAISAEAQTGYTLINTRYHWLAGIFKALGLPAGGNAAFTAGQAQQAGSVYYDSTGADAGLYIWSGLAWVKANYTDAQARAAISLTTTGTSGAATYNSGTGVFNIPQYSGTTNTNVGAFYRWLKPDAQEIKTFAAGTGVLIDSTTNTDALTLNLDSLYWANRDWVTDRIADIENGNLLFDSLGAAGISPMTTWNNTLYARRISISGGSIDTTASGGLLITVAGAGVTSLAAVGSAPNANGATISGSTLNLEPASVSFPGVVTTGSQVFAGNKFIGADAYAGTDGTFNVSTSSVFGAGAGSSELTITNSNTTTGLASIVFRNNAGSSKALIRWFNSANSSTIAGIGLGDALVFTNGTSGKPIMLSANAGPIYLAPNNTSPVLTAVNAGQVGLNKITSPTAWLHLPAGTTAASTAPFKYTSGSLQTTAEVGAKEFLTDKEYLTITTGAARKEITLNDIALTSGRIPFVTTNGRLTDVSTVLWDGTTATFPLLKMTGGSPGAGKVLTSDADGDATWTTATKPTLTKNLMLENPTASENIFIFRTPVAITVTDVTAVLVGGSPSVTYNVAFGTDRTSGTNVYTAGQTVTSETTGTAASGVNDATIPAGSWVWVTTSAATDVTQLNISLTYTED
jgi:hypothetical protein